MISRAIGNNSGTRTPPIRGSKSAIPSDEPPIYDEVSDDFDDVSRVVGRVVRFVAVFFPVWLILLMVFPAFGAQAGGSLFASTLFATLATWAASRWFWPRRQSAASDRVPVSPAARLMVGAILIAFAILGAVFLVAGSR